MNTDNWLDYCYGFNEGFGVVKLNGKWNHIDKEGKLLSATWFEDCYDFRNGFGIVMLNGGLWYNIDKEGGLYEHR